MRNIYILIAAIIVSFLGGYTAKKCPKIINEVVITDTIYSDITGGAGSPITIVTEPMQSEVVYVFDTVEIVKTKEVKGQIIRDTIKIHDTTKIGYANSSTWKYKDTLRIDSLSISLNYDGDCYGIKNTDYKYFGRQKTIINKIEKKVPLFSLHGGACVDFTNKNLNNIMPTIMLGIKNKVHLGYQKSVTSPQQQAFITFKIR